MQPWARRSRELGTGPLQPRDFRFTRLLLLNRVLCRGFFARNHFLVNVSCGNIDTNSILRKPTCGFAREVRFVSTFSSQISTRIRFRGSHPAVLLVNAGLCRGFSSEHRHGFDLTEVDLWLCQRTSICADVFARNRFYVDVPARNQSCVDVSGGNIGMGLIYRKITCGFVREVHFM